MSLFVKHEPCPKCGSKDNLSVWDDDHKWCFGCGHYIPADGKDPVVLKYKLMETARKGKPPCALPKDATHNLPDIAQAWLRQFQIYNPQAMKFHLKWTEASKALILPVYDHDNTLLYYQLRNFGENRHPKNKYLSFGDLGDHIPVFGVENPNKVAQATVVVVEDFVSAMRVSEYLPTSPLFGSYLNLQKANRLSRRFKHLMIWLDQDKLKQAMDFASRYSYLFDSVNVINTVCDPKAYSSYAIKNHLLEHKRAVAIH